MNLRKIVYEYPTENEMGFNKKEKEDLLTRFPKIDMNKFNDALMGITCFYDEEKKEVIIYPCDILTALSCGIENREMKWYEFD